MESSDTIAALAAALVLAQSEMGHAALDAENPHFRSRYATLAACLDAVRGPLTKHGLAVLQPVSVEEGQVVCRTRILHNSGEWIEESLQMPVDKKTAQGIGSAVSYARRYGLCAMLGITSADEDDDGQGGSQTAGRRAQSTQGRAANEKPEAAELRRLWKQAMGELVSRDLIPEMEQPARQHVRGIVLGNADFRKVQPGKAKKMIDRLREIRAMGDADEQARALQAIADTITAALERT